MKRGFALRFCYGAKGVEKHGENSQIIGGGRRSDAAGGRDFRVYAAMDLRAHGIPACVFLKNSAGRYLIRSPSATITGSISPRPRPTGTFISGRRSTRPGCCGQHSDGQKNGAAAK